MWNHKQLLVWVATKRSLSTTSHVLRNSSKPASRHLSSVVPNLNRDEDGHANESYSKKQALQHLLQASSLMPPMPQMNFHDPLLHETPTTSDQSHSAIETKVSPSTLTYTGNQTIPVTSHLHIVTPDEDTPRGTWPIFRIMVRVTNNVSGTCTVLKNLTMTIVSLGRMKTDLFEMEREMAINFLQCRLKGLTQQVPFAPG